MLIKTENNFIHAHDRVERLDLESRHPLGPRQIDKTHQLECLRVDTNTHRYATSAGIALLPNAEQSRLYTPRGSLHDFESFPKKV